MRKAVSIASIIKIVNDRNRLSTCSADIREGWNSLLESILHDANAYKGFGYLPVKDVPLDEAAGVRGTNAQPDFRHTDDTRRQYYA